MYAITKCIQGKERILLLPDGGSRTAADILRDALRHRHSSGLWSCLAYVIMPDHLHFVVKLLEGDLSGQVASFSKFTSREINRLLGRKGPTWQSGFYDHALRDERSLSAYLEYMRDNPVRAGLVSRPEEWPYAATMPAW